MITRKLAIFVGSTNVPNSLVTKPEFCDLLTTADPHYIAPGRTALSGEINKVLFDLKANIGLYLHDARKVSITADIWSKKGLMLSYMGITALFFSPKDHYRHRVTLAVRRMASPHTAERVLEVIEEVLAEWEIPYSKVPPTLTDNGSNMVAAFCAHFQNEGEEDESEEIKDESEQIEDKSGDSENEGDVDSGFDECAAFEGREVDHELVLGAVFKRVSCFSLTLQLVVNTFQQCKSFKNLLKSAHGVVRKVHKSTKATERLIALSGKKLVSDCPTRWSSTYLLVSQMLQVRTALTQVLEELEWDNLATSEWKSLEELLQPFAQYTALVSGEEYTTISTVIPVIMELQLHLEEVRWCVWTVYNLWFNKSNNHTPHSCIVWVTVVKLLYIHDR